MVWKVGRVVVEPSLPDDFGLHTAYTQRSRTLGALQSTSHVLRTGMTRSDGIRDGHVGAPPDADE